MTDNRDPLEKAMDAQEILAEMQICPHCKEVGACGCPNPNAPDDVVTYYDAGRWRKEST